jgi:Zn-dependent peptidase ImmA (M78 family)/transcriptional regulator with XRE-family HTH domain
MLILGRELRGLTQAELARQMEVTQGKISKMEDGLLSVSERDWFAYAANLRLPRMFFLRRDVKRCAFNFFYRKRASVPQKLLTQLNARVCFKQAQIERLMRMTEMDKSPLPQLDPDEVPGGPKHIAQQVRQFLRLPPGPIKDLIRHIEDAGIVVLFIDFGTMKLEGVSTFTNNGTPVIFVNSAFPPSRRIATVVHELGHMIMHRIPTEEAEDQAWEFAAEFLMPEADIRHELSPVTIDRLARLKLRWHVSMAYLLRRARSLNLITDKTYMGLNIHLSRMGYRKNEPHEQFLADETPALEQELIQTHLDELGYTREDICTLLDIGETDLDEILGTKPQVGLRIVD